MYEIVVYSQGGNIPIMFFFFIQVFFPFLLLYCTVIVLRVCVCGRVWKCDENLFGLIYVIISSMNYVHNYIPKFVFFPLSMYICILNGFPLVYKILEILLIYGSDFPHNYTHIMFVQCTSILTII